MKTQPEIINIDDQFLKVFKRAIVITEKETLLSNNTIEVKDNGEVIIEDTSAKFLIILGMNYQKLIS